MEKYLKFLQILYLRRVHGFCYYCIKEFEDERKDKITHAFIIYFCSKLSDSLNENFILPWYIYNWENFENKPQILKAHNPVPPRI